MTKKVLITGAASFTGQEMMRILKAHQFQVFELAADLLDKPGLFAEVKAVCPDWVIHLAALSFVGDTNLEAFYRVNVIGTENLLEALNQLTQKPQRVLIASSANIYGAPNLSNIDESVMPAPVNHYACSKLAMEYIVQTWFNTFPIIIVRPFNYTGIHQDERFLIPKIVSHFARKHTKIELGNLNVYRDFSDVRDVCKAYFKLLNTDVHSLKVNICSGRAVSLQEIIEYLNDLAGYSIEVCVNPAFVRQNEIPVLKGDNRLLKELIDFVPSIPIWDTLKAMLEAKYA